MPTRIPCRKTTVPSSGGSFPARMRSNVDFPAPFTPTSPTFSPCAIPSETSRKSHASRKDLESRSADKRFTIAENRYLKVSREFSGKKKAKNLSWHKPFHPCNDDPSY